MAQIANPATSVCSVAKVAKIAKSKAFNRIYSGDDSMIQGTTVKPSANTKTICKTARNSDQLTDTEFSNLLDVFKMLREQKNKMDIERE